MGILFFVQIEQQSEAYHTAMSGKGDVRQVWWVSSAVCSLGSLHVGVGFGQGVCQLAWSHEHLAVFVGSVLHLDLRTRETTEYIMNNKYSRVLNMKG